MLVLCHIVTQASVRWRRPESLPGKDATGVTFVLCPIDPIKDGKKYKMREDNVSEVRPELYLALTPENVCTWNRGGFSDNYREPGVAEEKSESA